MSADWELQKFIRQLLIDSEIGAEVYDDPPQNGPFPYVTIGDITSADMSDSCAQAWLITATIQTWSRYDGYKEVKQIQGRINEALRYQRARNYNGYNFLGILPDTTNTFRDPDGETRRGVQTFTVVVTEYVAPPVPVSSSSSEIVVSSSSEDPIISSSSSEPPVITAVHVYLAAGQSGNAGRLAMDPLIDTPLVGDYQYGNYSSDPSSYEQIVTLSDPLRHPDSTVNNSPQRTGPSSWFARTLRESLDPGVVILVVPCSQGGTALVTGATPPWGPTGSRFTDAVSKTNAAQVAAAAFFGVPVVFKGVLWMQGESDGDAAVTTAAYYDGLAHLINRFRAQITGASSSAFLVSSMVPEAVATRTGYPEIDAAHRLIPASIPRTVFVEGRTGYTSDNLHYNTGDGARLQGADWEEAFPLAEANAGITTYTFENDAINATPAGILPLVGTFNATNAGAQVLTGKYMRSTTAVQQNAADVCNLLAFAPVGVNQILTWRRGPGLVLQNARDGFILRPQVTAGNSDYPGIKAGYYFQVSDTNNQLRILKFNGTTTVGNLRSISVALENYTYYRASVTGTSTVTLDFEYSADGVSWTSIGSVVDSSSPFTTTFGTIQYATGFTGFPANASVDDISLVAT